MPSADLNDWVAQLGRVHKPGYVSPRAAELAARRALAQQLIAALGDAERAAAMPRSAAQLAQAAYEKLQFDFPVVSMEELEALAAAVRQRLDAGKEPRHLLTAALLANVTEAASRGEPGASSAASGSLEVISLRRGASSGASGAAAEGGSFAADAAQLRKAYQRLAASLTVRLLTRLLAQKPETAFATLSRYVPAADADVPSATPAAEPEQTAQQAAGGERAQLFGPGLESPTEAESLTAAEEDGEDFVFEAMEAGSSGSSRPQQPQGRPAASSSVQQTYSWQLLQGKLVHLAGHARYQALDDNAVWEADPALQRDALRGLQLARAHERAPDLAPIQAALLKLLGDRIAAHPGDLELVPSLWDALGLRELLDSAASLSAGKRGEFLAGARPLLSVAANLAGFLQQRGARAHLWRHIDETLMPLLGLYVEFVAEASRRGGSPEAAAGDLALPCQVLEFYVLQAQTDVHRRLLESGIFRALVVLFPSLAPLPAAAPLRRVLLLAGAASAELVAWTAAVPAFAKMSASSEFGASPHTQQHAALWRLLEDAGSGAAADVAPSLLDGAAGLDEVHGLRRLLQTMADMKRAARGRRRLWGPATDAALTRLAASLRAAELSSPPAGPLAEPTLAEEPEPASIPASDLVVGSAAVGRVVEEGWEVVGGGGAVVEDLDGEGVKEAEQKLHGSMLRGDSIQAEKAHEERRECLRLLKDLTVQGAGSKAD